MWDELWKIKKQREGAVGKPKELDKYGHCLVDSFRLPYLLFRCVKHEGKEGGRWCGCWIRDVGCVIFRGTVKALATAVKTTGASFAKYEQGRVSLVLAPHPYHACANPSMASGACRSSFYTSSPFVVCCLLSVLFLIHF